MSRILCIIPYYDFVGANDRLAKNHAIGVQTLERQGVDVLTIEAVKDDTPRITTGNVVHVPVKDVLWYKENLINYGIWHYGGRGWGNQGKSNSQVRPGYDFVAWIDSGFVLEDHWVGEAIKKLDGGYDVLHCFSHGVWWNRDMTGYERETDGRIYSLTNNHSTTTVPGGAWIMRQKTGFGLYDLAIVGGGDELCVRGTLNDNNHTSLPPLSLPHKLNYLKWHHNISNMRLRVSYIDGVFTHLWHATTASRQHTKRHQLLINHDFDPSIHLIRTHGMVGWSNEAPRDLKMQVRKYILERMSGGVAPPPPLQQTRRTCTYKLH